MSSTNPPSIRRDIASAYIASGARIASWAAVSAIVYRSAGAEVFAFVAFTRATLGIVNYAAVGLAPALVRLLAEAKAQPQATLIADGGSVLDYYRDQRDPVRAVYANGIAWAVLAAMIAGLIVCGYVFWLYARCNFAPSPDDIDNVAFTLFFGLGLIVRLVSDAAGAVLQTSDRIGTDNLLNASAEVAWILVTAALVYARHQWIEIGLGFLLSALLLACSRFLVAAQYVPLVLRWSSIDERVLRRLLGLGSLITLAQLADYLYAPTDYILINWLLDLRDVATYAPAIQLDAALLVLVAGIAAVLLPKAALAHISGDIAVVRRYYIRGTLASTGVLILAAGGVYILSPWIFRLWLKDPMSATRAILPLILIHTVIGGSSAVGRSILLGIGRVWPFTVAVLIAGVSNVVLSFVFVRYCGWGLRGIIAGTIVAVVARCGVWMPWYILRTLKQSSELGTPDSTPPLG